MVGAQARRRGPQPQQKQRQLEQQRQLQQRHQQGQQQQKHRLQLQPLNNKVKQPKQTNTSPHPSQGSPQDSRTPGGLPWRSHAPVHAWLCTLGSAVTRRDEHRSITRDKLLCHQLLPLCLTCANQSANKSDKTKHNETQRSKTKQNRTSKRLISPIQRPTPGPQDARGAALVQQCPSACWAQLPIPVSSIALRRLWALRLSSSILASWGPLEDSSPSVLEVCSSAVGAPSQHVHESYCAAWPQCSVDTQVQLLRYCVPVLGPVRCRPPVPPGPPGLQDSSGTQGCHLLQQLCESECALFQRAFGLPGLASVLASWSWSLAQTWAQLHFNLKVAVDA
jgi:hypothetical protein